MPCFQGLTLLSANPTKWLNTLKQFCRIGAERVKMKPKHHLVNQFKPTLLGNVEI